MVDASALTAFFLREEGWRGLAPYMVRTVSVDHVVKEFYNAVWKALVLRGRISGREAAGVLRLFRRYLAKNMELRDERLYIDEAYSIAVRRRITIYDALYIALAREEKLPLLTLDERQAEAARMEGVETINPATG